MTVDADLVTVRPAHPTEYDVIGRITVEAYRASGMIPEGSEYDRQLAAAAARAAAAELLVAVTAESEVLGTVTFCGHDNPYAEIARPGEAEFRMLAVAPGARGRGIGARLVNAVIDRARATGARALVLSAPENAHAAHRLYQRLGFVRIPERDWRPIPAVRLLAYQRLL